MIIEEIRNIKSTRKDLQKFAVTIGLALIIIGLFLLLFKRDGYIVLFSTGTIIIILGILFPILLIPFQKMWMILSILLGWLSTRIILSLLFYFVLLPIRVIAKLFGKNFLDLKIDKTQKSYWNYRIKKDFNPIDYERQF